MGWVAVDCFYLAEDRDTWWTVVNMVVTFTFHNIQGFLDQLSNCGLKGTVHPVVNWYGLLNDIASNSDHIVPNGRMMVNEELQRMWWEEVVTDLAFQLWIEVTEESHEKS
jgi:hypothetical protein